MFSNYFKTAIRNLFGNRVYSFINISGLALGLACAMLIILYVKDELSFDRFQANANHIYRVYSQATSPDGSQTERMGITGVLQGPLFTSKTPEIKSFVRVNGGFADIKSGTNIKSQSLLKVDSNFFSVFSFPLLSGNPTTCLLGSNSIVLSEDVAKREFGTTDGLGKIILLKNNNEFTPYTVTAVSKRCPQNSSIKFEALLPMKVAPEEQAQKMNWFSFFLQTYVLLDPRADVKTVESKITKEYRSDAKELIKGMEEKYHIKDNTAYKLQAFTDLHLNKDVSREDISGASDPLFSFILSGIAFFILLIASINFINLTVARSLKRAKEIGIRKVVGSNRKQLIIQFLGESFALCLAAFIFAVIIVKLSLPVFNSLSNKALAVSYLLDAKLVAGYIGLFALTGLLAGFYPALVLSNYNPVQTLYSRFQLAGKNHLQKALVVLQFRLASFLIMATFILFSQFNFLTSEKLGYDDSNLVLVNKQNLTLGESVRFKSELMKSRDILGASFKDNGLSITAAKISADSGFAFTYAAVDETFLSELKIPIVQGRNFSSDFPSDSAHAAIVNETFAKKAGWKNPIGQKLALGDETFKFQVIGVIKDYHYQSLSQEISPQAFTIKGEDGYGMAYIKIKPNSETASLAHIEKIFKHLFPLTPFSYIFKDQENLKNYEAEAKWKQILLFGAIITIFISCIGLFGLSVLAAEKRTKEIGIRKVLGASVGRVVSILSMDFLKLVIIALVISIPLAWILANKWLQNYPYRITLNWLMFAIAASMVLLIALLTISFHAIKTALANPVKSLRTE
jgi:putative ABC transport system permease protein